VADILDTAADHQKLLLLTKIEVDHFFNNALFHVFGANANRDDV